MAADNSVARSLHDLGLATWFGGSLMGAVGLNGAAAQVEEPKQRLRVANSGWNRWTPVNLAGIAAHLAGGTVLVGANKGRLASQQGVGQATVVKTALTGAVLSSTPPWGSSRAPPRSPAGCWAASDRAEPPDKPNATTRQAGAAMRLDQESTARAMVASRGRWAEYTQLSRQIKQAGLLERRRGWYGARIALPPPPLGG